MMNRNHERWLKDQNKSMNRNIGDSFFWKIFPFIFSLFGLIFLITMGAVTFLAFSCYSGNDPDAMSCFMISERVEVGVRHR